MSKIINGKARNDKIVSEYAGKVWSAVSPIITETGKKPIVKPEDCRFVLVIGLSDTQAGVFLDGYVTGEELLCILNKVVDSAVANRLMEPKGGEIHE